MELGAGSRQGDMMKHLRSALAAGMSMEGRSVGGLAQSGMEDGSAGEVPTAGKRMSEAGIAARVLSEEIIGGSLKAGTRLVMRDLKIRTGLGPTPLREGLTRLIARDLVVILDRRGFFVQPLDRRAFHDDLSVRELIEMAALRHSIERGDSKWTITVQQSLDELDNFTVNRRESPRLAAGRLSLLYKNLSTKVVSACDSPRLLNYLDVLHDRLILCYNNLVRLEIRLSSLPHLLDLDGYRTIVSHAMARETELACEGLKTHLAAISSKLGEFWPPAVGRLADVPIGSESDRNVPA